MKADYIEHEPDHDTRSRYGLRAQSQLDQGLASVPCPSCAQLLSELREAMAKDRKVMAELHGELSGVSRDASMAWGLAATGWLLLVAAGIWLVRASA
jgi:hypothetical protein